MYKYRYWLLALWLLAFWMAHLPWTSHPAAAFTLNSFDLAEQIRVHPALLAESPPLLTSALLWAIFPLLALGVALTALAYRDWRGRVILWGLAGLLALRVIPPQNLLRDPGRLLEDDYGRVLFVLTVLGLGLVGLVVIGQRWLKTNMVLAMSLTVVLAVVIPMIGFERAFGILEALQLEVNLGAGLVLYTGVMLMVGGLAWLQRGRPSQ
jgi:hypothetical protein